ncbi:hypothetical protein PILCRDRAFT_65721 [Piloderma croceum F 1598]|uniref:Major facilitator superfamily (MFS) profile domain-containing protein n=1 Tax=Piloderma croceum (strain F 1598) TaxID=765440 RepID=A0A0C3G1B4_PILCF|nr:hypothetical protein PILCRDRAFT_65721 [Piloderma croceum F 1598]
MPVTADFYQFEKSLASSNDGKDAQPDPNVNSGALKVDKYGLPLIPQPSDDPADPLNWSNGAVLLQASILAFMGPFGHSLINPAYVTLAASFHITPQQASYTTTIAIAFAGIGPFLWVPLANVYGRRPIYLFGTLVSIAAVAGAGAAQSYGTLLVARACHGFFSCTAMALGAATAVDLFCLHERGRALGVFTVLVTNGAHLASIPGGYLALFVGWRWDFRLPAILLGVMFIIMLVAMPETLYRRGPRVVHATTSRPMRSVVVERLRIWGYHDAKHKLHATDFVQPLQMFKYPSVVFPAIYYAVAFGWASIEPALTVATIFHTNYGFNTAQNGLVLGISLMLGAFIGELFGGHALDTILRQYRQKHDGVPEPEVKLRGIWLGTVMLPAGLLVYGFTIQYKVHYIVPTIGMGIANFGLQIIATVSYSYSTDCYKVWVFLLGTLQGSISYYSMLIELGIQPLGKAIGFQFAFIIYALIALVCFTPMLWLMRYGHRTRERMGKLYRHSYTIQTKFCVFFSTGKPTYNIDL